MKRSVGVGLPILLMALNAPAASAQQNQFSVFSAARVASPSELQMTTNPQEEVRPQDAMSMSGMFLGIVGMMGGAAVASGLKQDACQDSEDDDCLIRHAFTGALIAGTVLVPIGVHIANPKKKNLLTSLAVSSVTGAAMYFALRAIPGEPVHIAPFLAAPVQMVTSIKIETRK
jgi:hypothetical protein